MDPMKFLAERDPFVRYVMQRIAKEVREVRDLRDQNLAVLISNAIWKGVKARD